MTEGATADWPGLVARPGMGATAAGWPAGVTAVLVHGAMDRGAGMARLVRSLHDAPTIRYDRRGYGRARVLHAGGLVQQVDDLIGIVGHLPVVLFGHSFGGLVVLAAAASTRLDVRGIATYEVPAPWLPEWPRWEVPGSGTGPLSEDVAGDVAEHFLRGMIGDERWDRLPARTRADRRSEGRALLADLDAVLSAGAPFDPARITVPCVFGYGSDSPDWYRAAATWLADRVADGVTRRILDATHGAPLERPQDVAELVRMAAAG